jgi:hypothetical protein
MFLTAVIAISERGEERGKLDLVVAEVVGGELRAARDGRRQPCSPELVNFILSGSKTTRSGYSKTIL